MTIQNQKKLASHIYRLLKVNELIFPICRTNKGNLGLRFNSQNDDYEMYLDAVPLPTSSVIDNENNIELKRMLEKYLFELPPVIMREPPFNGFDNLPTPSVITEVVEEVKFTPNEPPSQKKRGRPAGSKNKPKDGTKTH